ncbi:MAG TPA: hypothetical protein VN851_08665 [Thermoanaerobaculia bacterium]|nr:hypothetical protein [Thermoanaerobaculia bacterium]
MSPTFGTQLTAVGVRLLVVYVAVEIFSFLGFLIATPQMFTFPRLAQERKEQVDAGEAKRPGGTNSGRKRATTLIVPHPHLGFVYDPKFNPEGVKKQHTVPVSEWGFLDDKPPIQAGGKDRAVIGIFGGSVSLWFSIHGIDALSEELAKVPELKGRQLIFVRTGLGGFKQPQQLMALTYLLALGAHFDMVINLDGFNEVALPPSSSIPLGYFPYFPYDWPVLIGAIGDPTRLRLVGEVTYLETRRSRQAQIFSLPGLRHSVFANLVWKLLDLRLAGRILADQIELGKAAQPAGDAASRPYAANGPTRSYPNTDAMYQEFAEVWMRSSVEMSQLCAARGIRYFHFLQPNQYLPDSKPFGAEEKKIAFLAGSVFEPAVRTGYPKLREEGRALAARGIAFEDMSRVFAAIDKPLYIDSCCHFNPEGNVILAHRIGESIRRRF